MYFDITPMLVVQIQKLILYITVFLNIDIKFQLHNFHQKVSVLKYEMKKFQ